MAWRLILADRARLAMSTVPIEVQEDLLDHIEGWLASADVFSTRAVHFHVVVNRDLGYTATILVFAIPVHQVLLLPDIIFRY